MKQLLSLLALAALAACASPSASSLVPAPAAPATITSLHPSLGNVFEGTAAATNAAGIKVESIGVIATINGKKTSGYVPISPPCTATDKGGVAEGCGLKATQTLHIKNMTAGLFTLPKAKGCLVAAGKWAGGTVAAGKPIPIKFLWTGKCK